MARPILASIHVGALAHNLQVVARRLAHDVAGSPPRIWAVVKAYAYGHGLEAALAGFAVADGLALLDIHEAVRCRELGWQRPILLLEGFFKAADLAVMDQHRISTVIHSQAQLDMLAAHPGRSAIDGHVMLNSGMHRLGFQPFEYQAAFAQAQALQQQGILGRVGKMTHFARADDDLAVTRHQLDCFHAITQGLPGPVSVCNSAAVLDPGLTAAVQGDEQWVRPGICLYGASPYVGQDAEALDLRPTMTLSAELISTHVLPGRRGDWLWPCLPDRP